jgi:hypothetical protein
LHPPRQKEVRHDSLFRCQFVHSQERFPALRCRPDSAFGLHDGPEICAPCRTTAPPAFRGADETQVSSDPKGSLGDEAWAAVYREPELQELIRKALANNFDVRIAAQRILEQEAQVKITRAQQFPTVTFGGTGIGAALPSSLGTSIPSPLVDGSFNFSLPGLRISGVNIASKPRPRGRNAAGAELGAAGGSSDAGAVRGDRLYSTARAG